MTPCSARAAAGRTDPVVWAVTAAESDGPPGPGPARRARAQDLVRRSASHGDSNPKVFRVNGAQGRSIIIMSAAAKSESVTVILT